MSQYRPYLTLVARVMMAVTFLGFGYYKLVVFTPAGTAGYLGKVYHAPLPDVAAWVAIIIEIVGGLAILVGFQTRWVAAVLALWCLFTAFGFHLPAGDPDNMGQFFKNLTMAAGFLYVIAYGPGPLSVDGAEKSA